MSKTKLLITSTLLASQGFSQTLMMSPLDVRKDREVCPRGGDVGNGGSGVAQVPTNKVAVTDLAKRRVEEPIDLSQLKGMKVLEDRIRELPVTDQVTLLPLMVTTPTFGRNGNTANRWQRSNTFGRALVEALRPRSLSLVSKLGPLPHLDDAGLVELWGENAGTRVQMARQLRNERRVEFDRNFLKMAEKGADLNITDGATRWVVPGEWNIPALLAHEASIRLFYDANPYNLPTTEKISDLVNALFDTQARLTARQLAEYLRAAGLLAIPGDWRQLKYVAFNQVYFKDSHYVDFPREEKEATKPLKKAVFVDSSTLSPRFLRARGSGRFHRDAQKSREAGTEVYVIEFDEMEDLSMSKTLGTAALECWPSSMDGYCMQETMVFTNDQSRFSSLGNVNVLPADSMFQWIHDYGVPVPPWTLLRLP